MGHDTGVVDAGKKIADFFSDQAGHDLEMKQPVRRVMQLATLKTTNGSPGISRHRSYTRQTGEVKNFAIFVFHVRRKQLTVVLGTAKNIRTGSQVTKQCSVPNALTTAPSPSETRGKSLKAPLWRANPKLLMGRADSQDDVPFSWAA